MIAVMKIKQRAAKHMTAVDESDAAALAAFCRRLGKPRAALIRRLVREAVPELRRRYDAAFAARRKNSTARSSKSKKNHDEG